MDSKGESTPARGMNLREFVAVSVSNSYWDSEVESVLFMLGFKGESNTYPVEKLITACELMMEDPLLFLQRFPGDFVVVRGRIF